MRVIHLDTDLGSDTDDLCALAMLLGWEGVRIAGVTTVTEREGLRAGFVRYALDLAGRTEVPVAAGAEGSLGGFRWPLAASDYRMSYWPVPIEPRPGLPGAALDLLARSVDAGATLVAIGPYTNLALLEAAWPGILAQAKVVLMGGCVTPPREELPPFAPGDDYNVQQDALAARMVIERSDPVLVQCSVTYEVSLRRSQLPRLRESGALGRLIAAQAEFHARDERSDEMARRYRALPADFLNFQYDPLACAVALGWDGVRLERIPLAARVERGLLFLDRHPTGRPLDVAVAVDVGRFDAAWLEAVGRASGAGARHGELRPPAPPAPS